MSYKFTVRADTALDVVGAANVELTKIVESSPEHAIDRYRVLNNITNFAGLITPTPGTAIQVEVEGSVTRDETLGGSGITAVTCNISVHLMPKSFRSE